MFNNVKLNYNLILLTEKQDEQYDNVHNKTKKYHF